MGSLTHPTIPVIDFRQESLKQGTPSWALTSKQVCDALAEMGCFEAMFDGVAPQLESEIFGASRDLFDLPKEVRRRNVNGKPSHGYTADIPSLPIYEGLGIDFATDIEQVNDFTNLMWPQGNDHFRDVSYSYAKAVEELNAIVVRMIFDHYGLKNYESHMESTSYLLRFLKYRPPRDNESAQGIPRHKDMTFLSILHQNNVGGLEIGTKDGQSWIPYDPKPDSFVVMAGEVGMGWSNDRMVACFHKVTMRAKEHRYSFGLFTFLTKPVQVPEKFVDEEYPLKYKPFTHGGFLSFFTTEEGIKARPHVLKAYSGI